MICGVLGFLAGAWVGGVVAFVVAALALEHFDNNPNRPR